MRRHIWGIILTACFVGSIVACFSVPAPFFWWAVLGACGTGVAAVYCFVYPPAPQPFEHVYSHEDWSFDPQLAQFPKLTIRSADHGMGKKPRLEFRQGDHFFPSNVDEEGNITVIRNNHSMGRFADLGVIVRHNPKK